MAPVHELETVGIIGAGVMGRGVCVALASAGLRVILVDRTPEILERARVLLHPAAPDCQARAAPCDPHHAAMSHGTVDPHRQLLE
jgi:3-hydroxyacyl-CoA dehydrogenase